MQELNGALISAVTGVFLPFFIDRIRLQFSVSDSKTAHTLSVIACIVAAVVISFLNGTLKFDNTEVLVTSLVINLGSIFTASQTFFKQVYEDSKSHQEVKRQL